MDKSDQLEVFEWKKSQSHSFYFDDLQELELFAFWLAKIAKNTGKFHWPVVYLDQFDRFIYKIRVSRLYICPMIQDVWARFKDI